MRADICNEYLCPDLKELLARRALHGALPVVYVATEGTVPRRASGP
jgi:hypothetical protein